MIKLSSILSEDLRKWFGKGPTGGWDRYNSKGEKAGKCGDSEEGSKYAACLSNEKAAKLGKDGRASFVKRKRAAQKDAGDSKKGGEQKKGQKPTLVKTGASEDINEAGMNPVKKVVNAILKKHNVQAMKTYASSVRGAHNIINGGYRWEGDWHLGFYGNVPQDVVEKVAAEMEKAGVKYVKVKKGHISADFTKTGLNEDWSQKYKNSIDCNNPKGFSQKAHCAGKNESMNEVAARYIEPKRVEAFLNKYPKVEELMQKIVDKVKDVDRGYQIFLHYKDDKGQERYFGGKKDTQSKSSNVKGLGRTALNKTGKSFNSKTSYKYEWNGKMDYPTWGELFQYVWNKKNESMNLEEKLNLFLEKNVPTDPQKWAASIAAAKKKFDVYPSAYANGWAAKNYKEKGGGWKTAK